MTTVMIPETFPSAGAVTLPIHKTMLPFLDQEGIPYTIAAISLSFVDLVYIEVFMTTHNLQAFLHAGIRIGKHRMSLHQSSGRA